MSLANNSQIKKSKNKKKSNKTDLEIKIEILKNKNIQEKNIEKTKIGPGSYNPETNFTISGSQEKKIISDVENFGCLERRFPVHLNQEDPPGAGAYIALRTWGPQERNYPPPLSNVVPPNVTKKLFEGISKKKVEKIKGNIIKDRRKVPPIGIYSPEKLTSIDYCTKKNTELYKNHPCFGSNIERKLFEDMIPKHVGVGVYNLMYKEKQFGQQIAPFKTNTGRENSYGSLGGAINGGNNDSRNKNMLNPLVGPGSYKNDSYFDWNKKSYNVLFA